MVWSLFSCSKQYPEAKFTTEEGFVDITFPISQVEQLPSGVRRFHVRGNLQKKDAGFIIELDSQWDPQKIEGHDVASFYWGKGAFCRSGEETDNFIRILAERYGLPPTISISQQRIDTKIVGLLTNPKNIDSERITMKFFFNSDADEDLYSEVFINIDLQNKTLEFNEKDEGYREPLINSLTKLPNHRVDPTVKTPVESGNEQGTAGHP